VSYYGEPLPVHVIVRLGKYTGSPGYDASPGFVIHAILSGDLCTTPAPDPSCAPPSSITWTFDLVTPHRDPSKQASMGPTSALAWIYSTLHHYAASGIDGIAVAPVPNRG